MLHLSGSGSQRVGTRGHFQEPFIYILDSDTGAEISRLPLGKPPKYILRDLCINPIGELLAYCDDQEISLWSLNKEKEVRKLRYADLENPHLTCIDFSPDGTKIASGGYDESVRIWDILNGEQLLSLKGHTHYVYDIGWMPDGTTLVSGGADSTTRVWDIDTTSQTYGSCLKILRIRMNCQGMQIIGARNLDPHQLEFFMDRGAILDKEQKNIVAEIRMQREAQGKSPEEIDNRYGYESFPGRGRKRILGIRSFGGKKS